MKTIWIHSVKYSLNILVITHLVQFCHGRIGDCSLPAAWRNTQWWYKRASSYNYYRTFTEYQVQDFTGKGTSTALTESSNMDCTEKFISNPLVNYVISPPDKTTPVDCVRTYQLGPVMLETSRENVGNVDPNQCPSLVDETGTDARLLVKYPFDFERSSCGIPDGTYQTVFAEDEKLDWQCRGDIRSETSVAGNKITINTCFKGSANYYRPYRVTLTCLVSMFPVFGDNTLDQLIVLGYERQGVWSFYCGRFRRDKQEVMIHMSINADSENEAVCARDHTASKASTSPAYRAFQLKPNACLKGVCLNGGNCTQRLDGYECQCLAGFTGKNCQTNLNECASGPCKNGGTCIDENNSFFCRCDSGYYGLLCDKVECDLPAVWRTRWWTDYIGKYQTMRTLTFEKSRLNYLQETSLEKLTCEDDTYDDSFTTFSLHYTASNNERSCARAKVVNNIMLYTQAGQTLRFKNVAQKESMFTAKECQAQIGSPTSYNMFVKFPWSFTQGGTCPFPSGSYQAIYSLGDGGKQCEGRTDSTSEISSNTLDINSCYSGLPSFESPLKSDLRCVGSFPGLSLDGQETTYGDVAVLAYKDDSSGLYSFYCTRYKIHKNQIHLSLNAKDKFSAACEMGKDYSTAGNGYVSMILTANVCASKNPCTNGGSCVDILSIVSTSYTCTCPSGFSGQNCEINADECRSTPCLNGGTCRDGINGFTCTCRLGFSGPLCEQKTCELPAEWISPANWWNRYISNYRNLNVVTFSRTEMQGYSLNAQKYYCEGLSKNADGGTYVSWAVGDAEADRKSCSVSRQSGEVLLSKISPIETRSNAYTSSDCTNRIRNTDPWDVYVSHPFSFTNPGQGCPWPSTTYQMSYKMTRATPVQCENDRASTATVPSPNKLQLNSCSGVFAYQTPFNGELTCVQSFSETEIDGRETGKGNVVILAYKNPDGGFYSFYCARYKVGEAGVDLSLNTASPYSSVCETTNDVRYNVADNRHRYIRLRSFVCASRPCQNGGECKNLLEDYVCTCKPGFTGKFCQTNVNECLAEGGNPCLNGGTCDDGDNGYTCRCLQYYTGNRCENFNDCAATPCRNGATCRDTGSQAVCVCKPGYRGQYCEIDIDECSSSPCQNGGTCRDRENSFTCQCPYGTTGARCEIDTKECQSQPCVNGGTCEERINGYYCRCTQSYIGVHCEHDNECGSNPCRNGATCWDDLGFYRCFCPVGYEGTHCEKRSTNQIGGSCDGTNTCLNGGLCRLRDAASGSTQVCTCPVGYIGDKCQTLLSCQTNGCQNGGTCGQNGEQYICTCPPGYGGVLCQTVTDPRLVLGTTISPISPPRRMSTLSWALLGVGLFLLLLFLIVAIVVCCRRRTVDVEEEEIYVDASVLTTSNLMLPVSNVYEVTPANYKSTNSIIVSHY